MQGWVSAFLLFVPYSICILVYERGRLVEHSGNRHKAVKELLRCLKKMTPTAGAMEKMKVQWLLVTMHVVHVNGFILNVWV